VVSIERTAYPRFRPVVPSRELRDAYTPSLSEIAWARGATRSEAHLLSLVVMLKCFQRLGYFPRVAAVPGAVVEHVRGFLQLPLEVPVAHDSERTLRHHRALIRARLKVLADPQQARLVAEAAIRAAAQAKDNPADLINVALEELVRARCELPGYTTLDELVARLRAEVNGELFGGIARRLNAADRARLDGLLVVDPQTRRSAFDRLKQPAKAATLSRFKEHLATLAWADSLGATEAWLAGVPPAKVAHFAAEARALDAAELRDVGDGKRLALVACLLHTARARGRDELAGMFCRRLAAIHKRGKEELEAIRERHRAELERLWAVFGDVLAGAREALGLGGDGLGDGAAAGGPGGGPGAGGATPAAPHELQALHERAGALMLRPLEQAGGVRRVSAEHEALAAHHGNDYLPLLARHYRSHRTVLFGLLDVLQLEATTADRTVLDAAAFLKANRHRVGESIPDHVDGVPVDLGFASELWQKIVRDRRKPGMLVRRHFEVCVFSALAEELRTGDVAVVGAEAYANYLGQLLSWEACAPLVADYCAEAGLPATAGAFVAALRQELTDTAARVDAGYPDNADLVIDDDGRPRLKRRRGQDRRASTIALERAIEARLPEWGLLDVLTRTAYWLEWHRHFGPLSGSDPKLADALGRYVVTAFAYGTNLGPYQASRHLRGAVSPHEVALPAHKHVTAGTLNRASVDVINAYARLDLPKRWGDGSRVAADGTQLDTWADNLLAETSIRYGGYGGIAYRHIADTYIALFSHFIPCGVWEAVYILEGLLRNTSDVRPETIHADTQGQSLPAFGLAAVLGFDLLPRIRNWQDLTFYRPSKHVRYRHIDPLFARDGREDAAVDWRLLETHWADLLRTVLSIREGRISSALLLRKLGHESRKNRLYRAFRELGRVVRTIVLLRYLSEPGLREGITAITNRAESFHNFSKWLSFGNAGVLADNAPEMMEKLVKFNELLANCVIFHTALDMTRVLNGLRAEGHSVHPEDVAALSPYLTHHIRRFGDYVLDLSPPSDPPPAHLDLEEREPGASPAPGSFAEPALPEVDSRHGFR
jgi:TnpA family transposase